ncbi:hypothetical protein [Neobacillus mesonae]|uniref:hypothetical protein n=1 Tax=Neobacillus mesonae TaxID=1193713 RepID=UPI0008375E2E|nr:hypothetical protein [Neobacillus mesonae]
MSLKLFCIAFFKEHKVKYFIQNEQIVFQCYKCNSEAVMEQDTNWSCTSCGLKGSMKNLMDTFKNNKDKMKDSKPFYNPTNERHDITKLLNKVIKENSGTRLEKDLIKISEKFQLLMGYMLKKDIENQNINTKKRMG